MASEYRRHPWSDTWHFCTNCSKWPVSQYVTSPTKPSSGELCDECRAKAAAKNCK